MFIQVWTWSSSQTGLLVCGAGSHPSYHLGVVRRMCKRLWHSDNEPLVGPQNSPKLIVRLSLGNSVEFMVRRRAPGKVPSSIRLDHGDILVMDGLAQSEYEHYTASGLQGPRVNLTYRWLAQHTASCPPAGVVDCVLPTCAQGLVEPNSRWLGGGRKYMVLFLGIGPPFVNCGVCPSDQHLDSHLEGGHRHSGQRQSCSAVHFSSRGRARWVGRRRWRLSRRRQFPRKVSFYFPCISIWRRKLQGKVSFISTVIHIR